MPKKTAKLSVAFLFDDTLDSNDGVAQYVKRLGAWLSDQGHQVSYLVGESQIREWHGGRVYSLAHNLKISWGGNRLSISLIPKIKLIKRVLRENRFDIIHVQVPYSPFMGQQVINRASSMTAVVGTVHAFPGTRLTAWGSKLLRILYGSSLSRFDFLASVSPAAQEYAQEAFGVSSKVSPNVINLEDFKTNAKKGRSRKIVFLGRLVERKGCGYLIEAFAKLVKTHPDVKLIVGGDGPQRPRLEKLADQLGLGTKVKFLGSVSEASKAEMLAQADIACFPSLYGESFGIVLIEAMAAGSGVVVGGDNPGYKSVLKRPETIVEPKNTEAFASRLSQLLSDKEMFGDLHDWQQREVKQYDVATVGSRWLELYGQLIANRQQNRHN